MRPPEIRACLLQVIADRIPRGPGDQTLQVNSVLEETWRRLGSRRDPDFEEAVLTVFYDLFRTGHLAWGFNLSNPGPPFFHLTDQVRKTLSALSRDPANPEGYLRYLSGAAALNEIANSYVREAIACFVQDLPKAAAVMIGAASESIALELRDSICSRLNGSGRAVPNNMKDWRLKVVLDAMYEFLEQHGRQMPRDLRDSVQSYWPAFLQQIRTTRNDAGHPSSVEPVTYETVHASLLILPELAQLSEKLRSWVERDFQ